MAFETSRGYARTRLQDNIGKHILFTPREHIPVETDDKGNHVSGGVKTTDYGYKPAVVSDMVVFDLDTGEVSEYFEQMVFQIFAINDLKNRIGGQYLALIEWGPEKIKGNYPILLNPPTEAGVKMATDYVDANPQSVPAAAPAAESTRVNTVKAVNEDPWATE